MLKIYLLGHLQFKSSDDEIVKPKLRRKTRAILSYLCIEDKSHTRQFLWELFCSDSDDPAGNLRWHLSRIRRILHEDILLTPDQSIQINHQQVWLDTYEFEQLSAQNSQRLNIEQLENLLALYRGELLTDIALESAIDYEFWLLAKRAYYMRIFEAHTLTLIEQLIQTEKYKKALEWANRLLQYNPELEDVHYWLMWLYTKLDQADVAIQQFVMYEQFVWDEFAAKPSDRMQLLRHQIDNNELPQISQKPKLSVPRPLLEQHEALFVGRETERQVINSSWQKTATGVGAFISIVGEAGIGKSALIADFIHSNNIAHDVPVFHSTCYKSTSDSTLVPWIKIIRTCVDYVLSSQLIDIPAIISNRLHLIMPDLLGHHQEDRATSTDKDLNRELLLNTIVDFFCLIANHAKIVIAIEDIHYADELSIQLLTLLLNRLAKTPLFILSSHRAIETLDNENLHLSMTEWRKFSQYKVMELHSLEADDVIDIIEKTAPQIENRIELAGKLTTHTMGITLHIIEILQELQNDQDSIDDLPIPPTFKTMVLHRLQTLTESQKQTVEMLAVLDYPSTLNEILECTAQNEQELLLSLEQLTKNRFIKVTNTESQVKFIFSHFLYSEIIYEQINDLRKRLLHQHIARKYERQALVLSKNKRQDIVNRLVYHAQNASAIDILIRWTPIVANYAKDVFAYRQALRFYENLDHLLQASPNIDLNDYARLILNMSEILRFLGDWKVQEELLERVHQWYDAKVFQNRDLVKTFLVEYGANQFRLGHYDTAVIYLNQSIELASRAEDEVVLAQSFNTLGNIAYYQGNWDDAEKNYKLGIEIRENLGDAVGIAKGYNNLGAIAFRRDNYELAIMYYEKNLHIRETHNDKHGIATALNNLGAVCQSLGEAHKAKEYCVRALEIRQELDDKHGMSSTLSNLGQISTLLGQYDEAINYYCSSIELRDAIDDQAGLGQALVALGNTYIYVDDLDNAWDCFTRSLKINQKLGAKLQTAESLIGVAFVESLKSKIELSDSFYDGLKLGLETDSRFILVRALSVFSVILHQFGHFHDAARYIGLAKFHNNDMESITISQLLSRLSEVLDADTVKQEMAVGADLDIYATINKLWAKEI